MADISSSKYSAWSMDGVSEVLVDFPVSPDRLVCNEPDKPTQYGSICFLEPHEIDVIRMLSNDADDAYDRNVLKKLYERIK
jgi:hypothetical protein